MEQLEMFGAEKVVVENGKRKTEYEINWNNIIGIDRDMVNVKGYGDLTDKAQELLKYLIYNHARPEDGFIHANKLAHLLGLYTDTRTLRKLCAEIDYKTEYVIYSSQDGYKLAGSDREMEQAIKFALAPAMTSIRRVFTKNKRDGMKWLHGFLGNLEKEFDCAIQGQQELDVDNNLEQREVNHYPKRPDYEYIPTIEERAAYYEKLKEKRHD